MNDEKMQMEEGKGNPGRDNVALHRPKNGKGMPIFPGNASTESMPNMAPPEAHVDEPSLEEID